MKVTSYKDLIVWRIAVEIAKDVYAVSSNEHFKRDHSLKDQIRRASISISSNIVEGFERNGTREFVRYLRIAKGSLGEMRSQLYLAKELGYVTNADYLKIDEKAEVLSHKIGALIKYLRQKRTS